MKARLAKYADVEHVLENLSTITEAEMKAFHVDRWNVMQRARACKKGLGGLDCLFIDEGNPLAIIGSLPVTDHPAIHRTWFIARQEYFDMGAKAVFGSMRYMTALANSRPNITWEAVTASEQPDLDRWFAFMGFTLAEQFENIRTYRRLPKSPVGAPANGHMPPDLDAA